MGIRDRRVDVGRSRARELVLAICREIATARRSAALSQAVVADRVGVSPSQYSRIERGLSPNVPIPTLAGISAVLGLDLAMRLYAAGDAVRDAAQVALLARLRERLHPSLVWHTEVPLPGPGDRRAWDTVVRGFLVPEGRGWVRGAIEAETRPRDSQALERRLALKQRDGGIDWLILLLADTRHNRTFLAGPGASLRARFPLDGRRALELLAAGVDPGQNAIILL
jgi:transcriptional regulator with XRE-family HTH domain